MAAPHLPSLADRKRQARALARARRAACDPALGAQLASHLLRDLPPPPGAIIGGYWPLPGEIDIRPLLCTLYANGHHIVLPETPPRGEPLRFRTWRPGATMQAGRFATLHSTGAEATPTWVLVPLLAFDAHGHRLGYGGGYYDRTLALLPEVMSVGCAFGVQEMSDLPVEPFDRVLDFIATELGVIVPVTKTERGKRVLF